MGFKIDKGKSWKNVGKKTGKGTSDFFTDKDGSKEDFFTDADGSKKDFFEGFGKESNYKDNIDPTKWGKEDVSRDKTAVMPDNRTSLSATFVEDDEEDDTTNDVEIEQDEDTGEVVITRSKKSKNKSNNDDNMTIVYYSLAGIFILGLGVMMTE